MQKAAKWVSRRILPRAWGDRASQSKLERAGDVWERQVTN